MYAIIEDSGTQIRVSEGDVIRIDVRELAEDQQQITFDRVLAIGGDDDQAPVFGEPVIEGASVSAELVEAVRSDRVPVVKFKRRKNYRRRKSHRQNLLEVKITGISR